MPTAANAKPDSRACAACRHQRRKCRSDCQWAEFFPAALPQTFANARSLYGLRNMNELTRNLPPEARRVAMETIIFESNMRAFDRVGGCYRLICDLAARVRLAESELRRAHQLLALLRASDPSIGDNVDDDNLGLSQKLSEDQEVLLRNYFATDDIGASTSSCPVDESSSANLPCHVRRSNQPLNFIELSSGAVPVMENTSSMYNNQLEIDPSSTAKQLCLPSNKTPKTDEGANLQLLDGFYKRDQPSDFLELKSLVKINKPSSLLLRGTSWMDGQLKINEDSNASQLFLSTRNFLKKKFSFTLKGSTKAMASHGNKTRRELNAMTGTGNRCTSVPIEQASPWRTSSSSWGYCMILTWPLGFSRWYPTFTSAAESDVWHVHRLFALLHSSELILNNNTEIT